MTKERKHPMRKTMLILALAAVAVAEAAPKAELTPEQVQERKAKIRERIYQKTGGFLERKTTRGKRIAFLNMQSRVGDAAVAEVLDTQNRIVRHVITFEKFEGVFDIAKVPAMMQEADVAEAIFVVDVPYLPSILVANESKWAVINVYALASDNPEQLVLDERLRLEMWRAIAFLNGAANTMMGKCVMQSVLKNADLDGLGAKAFSPEPLNKIFQHLELVGAMKRETCSYLKACEEGWAPAPTNDVQKAIWDKVHAMPTEPIKIKPEEKKTEK